MWMTVPYRASHEMVPSRSRIAADKIRCSVACATSMSITSAYRAPCAPCTTIWRMVWRISCRLETLSLKPFLPRCTSRYQERSSVSLVSAPGPLIIAGCVIPAEILLDFMHGVWRLDSALELYLLQYASRYLCTPRRAVRYVVCERARASMCERVHVRACVRERVCACESVCARACACESVRVRGCVCNLESVPKK